MRGESLNKIYSRRSMRRRYEVWFLRFMLADGSGAWWLRYLLLNLGRTDGGGCRSEPRAMPVQLWATWFPRGERPQSFIQGFSQETLLLSDAEAPFRLNVADSWLSENSCAGRVEASGHVVSWDLTYESTFSAAMSEVGWVGFSRTPHSDAIFSGTVTLDGRTFTGRPLGYGLQGHNCGYRHRKRWTWVHCVAVGEASGMSSFEALEYEIGFGLRFRKALLWHSGTLYKFRDLSETTRDRDRMIWAFSCSDPKAGIRLRAEIDGGGPSLHRLPYMRTDCSGTFDVANNSLANATLVLTQAGGAKESIESRGGAALEMAG